MDDLDVVRYRLRLHRLQCFSEQREGALTAPCQSLQTLKNKTKYKGSELILKFELILK